MDAPGQDSGFGQAVNGYPRAEVEQFLHEVARERARLEAQIADANARIARSRAAISTHRVMVSMLVETQRELSAVRRQGEAEAAKILEQAEAEVRMLRAAAEQGDEIRIDLTEPESTAAAYESVMDSWPSLQDGSPGHPANSDEFFAFLREALVDDQPLGPAADPAV